MVEQAGGFSDPFDASLPPNGGMRARRFWDRLFGKRLVEESKTERAPASKPDDHRHRAVVGLRRRIGLFLSLHYGLQAAAAFLTLWAAVVVGMRAAYYSDPRLPFYGLPLLVPVVLGAIFYAVRRLPTHAAVRALLDREARLGGLLMASGEGEIGGWRERIAEVPLPKITWRWTRDAAVLVGGVAFLLAAALAPNRVIHLNADDPLEVAGTLNTLAQRVELLKRERILSPEKAQVLEKDIERVRQEAVGKEPAKTLEAMDHIEQSLAKTAAAAAESAVRRVEKASRVQEMAQSLQGAAAQLKPEQLNEAMKELNRLAEQAAANDNALSEALAEAGKNGNQLTDEQLQKLAEQLKNMKACDRAALEKLIDAQLIDAALLKECDGAGECDPDALERYLAQCEGECDGDVKLLVPGDKPGRGGVSRGRGDAEMSWTKEGTEKGDAEFKAKKLPPGAVSPKKSQLLAMSKGAPQTPKEGPVGSSGSALAGAQAGGGESHTATVLPKHRKTVQRYFDRTRP